MSIKAETLAKALETIAKYEDRDISKLKKGELAEFASAQLIVAESVKG